MGVEALSKNEVVPLVLGLQPSALVDHVARVDWSLLDQIPGEHGGSIPVLIPFTTFLHCFSFFGMLTLYFSLTIVVTFNFLRKH